jgi:alcohol dehydrogenase class IV
VGFLSGFLTRLGLNTKLREHGVRAEQLDELASQAWEDPCHKTNAIPVTQADLRALYQECW